MVASLIELGMNPNEAQQLLDLAGDAERAYNIHLNQIAEKEEIHSTAKKSPFPARIDDPRQQQQQGVYPPAAVGPRPDPLGSGLG